MRRSKKQQVNKNKNKIDNSSSQKKRYSFKEKLFHQK